MAETRSLTLPMAAKPDILPPDELLKHIFIRLPAKTLGRFKCVCKLWYILISDPYFVQKHLKNYKHRQNLLLIISDMPRICFSINTHGIFDPSNLMSQVVFSSEVNPSRRIEVMGSCNGLILLLDEACCMFLANPTTGIAKKIKDLHVHKDLCCAGYGFGYDPSTDDYIVIAIFYYNSSENVVLRYSSRTDSWKKLDKSPYRHTARSRLSGVLVQDRLHWLANDHDGEVNRLVIVAFDLVEKRFKEVPCPIIAYHSLHSYNRTYDLMDVGGFLGLIVRLSFDQVCLYVMRDYGVEEFRVNDAYSRVFRPLCLLEFEDGDQEILWEADGHSLYALKRPKCLWWYRELWYKYQSGGTCLETLVSPQELTLKNVTRIERGVSRVL